MLQVLFSFFIKSCKILFQFLFLLFYKITKMKIKYFECPKSIRTYEKENTWKIRCLVDESLVSSAQRTSVLYCRLLDFMSLVWPVLHMTAALLYSTGTFIIYLRLKRCQYPIVICILYISKRKVYRLSQTLYKCKLA